MNAMQQTSGSYGAPSADPTPLTRDLNVLGEALARLDSSLSNLGAQLMSVSKPATENLASSKSADHPKLVANPRSEVGNHMEVMAASTERMIQFVHGLSARLEV